MRAWLAVLILLASCEDTRRARDRDRDHDDDPARALREHTAARRAPTAMVATARCAGPDCLPDVAMTDLDGIRHERGDLDNQVVVLWYWAAWARPAEHDVWVLERIVDRYPDVAVLGIAIAGDHDEVDQARRRLGITFPVIVADTALAAHDLPDTIPVTRVYDRFGARQLDHEGAIDEDELAAKLDELRPP